MKVIDERGRVLPVDDSCVDYENEFIPSFSNVVMVDDDVYLQSIWIVSCQKDLSRKIPRQEGLEFVNDKVYDHIPTKDELIQFMCSNGCGLCDVVSVQKGYRLMAHDDE